MRRCCCSCVATGKRLSWPAQSPRASVCHACRLGCSLAWYHDGVSSFHVKYWLLPTSGSWCAWFHASLGVCYAWLVSRREWSRSTRRRSGCCSSVSPTPLRHQAISRSSGTLWVTWARRSLAWSNNLCRFIRSVKENRSWWDMAQEKRRIYATYLE